MLDRMSVRIRQGAFGLRARLVEHLTVNQVVVGSNPTQIVFADFVGE